MKVEWELECPLWDAAPLALTADCCQAAEGVSLPLGVHVILTTLERMRRINREQRGVDSPTDVLSFPTVNYPKGQTARHCLKRLRAEYDPDAGACMLGDIVLCLPRAVSQAAQYGHSLSRELCYLLAHGLFHLMGYDHMTSEEQREMRLMEEKTMRMAGLSPCGEAADDETLLALARQAMERSYSPYSHYPVGAALLCANGRVYQGCNIENASFGLSNCAERTALFKAVSEGERDFCAIAIASVASAPWPCGACRQALHEFAPDLRILVTWGDGRVEKTTLSQLLPHGFGPQDINA